MDSHFVIDSEELSLFFVIRVGRKKFSWSAWSNMKQVDVPFWLNEKLARRQIIIGGKASSFICLESIHKVLHSQCIAYTGISGDFIEGGNKRHHNQYNYLLLIATIKFQLAITFQMIKLWPIYETIVEIKFMDGNYLVCLFRVPTCRRRNGTLRVPNTWYRWPLPMYRRSRALWRFHRLPWWGGWRRPSLHVLQNGKHHNGFFSYYSPSTRRGPLVRFRTSHFQ